MNGVRVVLAISGAFLLMQCSGTNPSASEHDTGSGAQQPPFAVAKASGVAREPGTTDQALLDEQVTSINEFALDLYREKGIGDENFFFSPYSIVSALGMTDAGARGETDRQIRQALSVTLEGDDFHAAMNGLDRGLMEHAESADDVTLRVVNSAWAQTGHPFRAAYLDVIARYYGAGVNLLDFDAEPDPSRIVINDWVSGQTNEKIKDLLPPGSITSLTRLVLTNAVYFLADWLYTFDKSKTEDADFTRLDGSTVPAPLMKLGEDTAKVTLLYAWDETHQVRAVQLPYKGDRLAMTLLLPEPGTFASFEQDLSVSLLASVISRMDSTRLPPVRIPKFTFKSGSISLKPAFRTLGMVDAFEPAAADFSGLDGQKWLYVTDIIHKSFIAVDEQGTEAAAATAVVIGTTSVPTHYPSFVADRPFVYCIRDTQTGVIIFMGKVTDPLNEG